jgi:hypothetical protein
MKGPYGEVGDISLYIQKEDGTEKQFDTITDNYNIDLILNQVDSFSFGMEGITEDDKTDYLQNGRVITIFSGNKLHLVGRINKVAYESDEMITISGESYGVSQLMDQTTESITFDNVNSCDIICCLNDCASPVISLGHLDNAGRITFRTEYDNKALAISRVASATQYDWWASQGSATCYDTGTYGGEGYKEVELANSSYNWTQSAGACTVYANTQNKQEGYSSIGMGGEGACTSFDYTKTLIQSDTCMPFDNFQVWLYVKDKECMSSTYGRICLYQNSDNEGYYVDLSCANISNGWNLIGKEKTDFTASASASWGTIDRLKMVWCPSNTGDISAGDLGLDYFLNYDYGTNYLNVCSTRGEGLNTINQAEATTNWSALCTGDSVALSSTAKCGNSSIALVKAQTTSADSEYQLAQTSNMLNRYGGFWFYLDETTCTTLHTDETLKLQMTSDNFTGYKEWSWSCKDLKDGWQFLMVDNVVPESVTNLSSVNDTAIDKFKWIINSCEASCTYATDKIMIDQVVDAPYGIIFDGKYENGMGISNEEDANSVSNKVTFLGAGDGDNQIRSVQLGATTNQSCLTYGESNIQVELSDTETGFICMYDTAGYPTGTGAPLGTVCINAECLTYTDNDGTNGCLCGLARAQGSTVAQIHPINESVATLTNLEVIDTTNFGATGTLCLGQEQIAYTGITGNCFTGITRGANSTSIYSHSKNTRAYDAQYTTTSYQVGSSIDVYGIKETTITCRSILDQDLLDRTAQIHLENNCCTPRRIKGSPYGLDFYSRVALGDTILVSDRSSNTEGPFRIVRLRNYYSDDLGNAYEFELSNRRIEMVEELRNKADEVNQNQQYMQGATNVYQLSSVDNVDTGYGTVMKFFLPEDTKAINCMKLSYSIGDYRLYHANTGNKSSGQSFYMGPSLDITEGNDASPVSCKIIFEGIEGASAGASFLCTTWMASYMTRSNNSSNVDKSFLIRDQSAGENIYVSGSIDTNLDEIYFIHIDNDTTSRAGNNVCFCGDGFALNDEMTFSYIVNAEHNHALALTISDNAYTILANTAGDQNIAVYVDGTEKTTDIETALGHCLQTTESEIDLVSFSEILTPGQWHCVEVRSCDGLGRIETNLYNKVYIES